MPALASTRLLLFVGESLPFQRLSGLGRACLFPRNGSHGLRFISQVVDRSGRSGPLTLDSLGFKREEEAANGGEVDGVERFELGSKVRVSKGKAKDVRSNVIRGAAEATRRSVEIEGDEGLEMGSKVRVSKGKAKDARSNVKLGAAEVTRRSVEIEGAERLELGSKVRVSKGKAKDARSNVKLGAAEVTRRSVEIEGAPFAAKSFSELGVPPLLIDRLEKEGFTVPTDVQCAAIPTIRKSHDVVIQSYTGSGKTLAYLLPILSEIGPLKDESLGGDKEPGKKKEIEAVIVAPSRELAMQIVREFEKLLGPANKRVVQQLVGGANRSRQEEALKKNKPAIVVGTPGRVAEISAAGKLHTHDCRYLVLDEVDELLSFNFREDMHRIIEHVGRRSGSGPSVPKSPVARRVERQTIMVSATVPFSVIRAAKSWGHDPLLVQARQVSSLDSLPAPAPVNLSRSSSSSGSSSNQQAQQTVQSLPPNLKHYHCVAKLQHKVDALRKCVHALDAKCVIAFMNHTRQLKDAVFKLEARGLKADELHGDLGKLARSTILKRFKNGELRILVTNELSARGLDVPECDLVVNLDLPTDSIHYAHRAGRTGRLGRKGTVVTICEESELFVVRKMQKQLGVPIPSCEFSEGKFVVAEAEDVPVEALT